MNLRKAKTLTALSECVFLISQLTIKAKLGGKRQGNSFSHMWNIV